MFIPPLHHRSIVLIQKNIEAIDRTQLFLVVMETGDASHYHPVWHRVVEESVIAVDEVGVFARVHQHACTEEANDGR